MDNTGYFGDCLRVLTTEVPRGSVDLMYLDPPFNSGRNYGKGPMLAFADQWTTRDLGPSHPADYRRNLMWIARNAPRPVASRIFTLLQFVAQGGVAL